MRLDGKTALVTGGSRGIGRAIALRLAAEGAFVLVHYRAQQAGAEQTLAEIEAAGGRGGIVSGDVATDAGIAQVRDGVTAALGGKRLDILVNNAGLGSGGGLAEEQREQMRALFATNVEGPFFLTQALLDSLADGGRVINISSMVAAVAYPGYIAYSMSKATLNSFTRSLAADLGKRSITVNAVAPGATDTDFIAALKEVPGLVQTFAEQAALGRLGQPEDIAAVVAFLASDDGRWVTGQVIQASGGMHL